MNFITTLKKILGNYLIYLKLIQNNELILNIKVNKLVNTLYILRYHTNFCYKTLVDIVGVDNPNRKKRFELNYLVLSYELNSRLIIKINLYEGE